MVSTQHGVLGTGAGCRRMCRYSQFAGAGLISGSMKESEVGIGAGYCVYVTGAVKAIRKKRWPTEHCRPQNASVCIDRTKNVQENKDRGYRQR